MNKGVTYAWVDALLFYLLVMVTQPMNPSHLEGEDPTLLDALVVEAKWEDGSFSDVDLWVQSPGDGGYSVGYSRRQGNFYSLVRDELGRAGLDPTRQEIAMARGTPDGSYAVNLHLYRGRPVPVEVRIFYRDGPGSYDIIWEGTVNFEQEKQEITVIRWDMIGNTVIPGSFTDEFVELRGT